MFFVAIRQGVTGTVTGHPDDDECVFAFLEQESLLQGETEVRKLTLDSHRHLAGSIRASQSRGV